MHDPGQACAICGSKAGEHDLNIRFRLPEPMLRDPQQLDVDELWMSESDPDRAVMIQHPQYGGFVRALLPIRLINKHTVTYGVWVGIHPDDLHRAFDVWWAPEYQSLKLNGRLANPISQWDIYGKHVELAVIDPDATPVCVGSDDDVLRLVLSEAWDHKPGVDAGP